MVHEFHEAARRLRAYVEALKGGDDSYARGFRAGLDKAADYLDREAEGEAEKEYNAAPIAVRRERSFIHETKKGRPRK